MKQCKKLVFIAAAALSALSACSDREAAKQASESAGQTSDNQTYENTAQSPESTVQAPESTEPSSDTAVLPENYFELENTPWGMTLDETLKAYDTDRSSAAKLQEATHGSTFAIEDGREMFGAETAMILFNFLDPTVSGGVQKLCQIDIVYPDDTDMRPVVEAVKQSFGEPVKKVSYYTLSSSLSGDTVPKTDYESDEHLTLWAGQTVSEVVPEALSAEYEKSWETPAAWLTPDNWDAFAKEASLVTVFCSDDASGAPVFGKKAIRLDAVNLTIYNTITKQLHNSQ